MGTHSDKARETLLDAAEELFARHGIDAVSNRRIAEHAGTANHSAVAYHFGGRDELMRALLVRHLEEMDRRRAAMIAGLGDDAGVRELLAAMLLPWLDHLASLPTPSWRARFLFQVRTVPSVAQSLSGAAGSNRDVENLIRRLQAALGDLPAEVIRGRSAILGSMVLGVSANYEARIQAQEGPPNWTAVGYFFIDACTGMLSAPVTHPDDFTSIPAMPYLL